MKIYIFFSNLEKSYYILILTSDSGKDHKVCGYGDNAMIGDRISAKGKWKIDSKYGRQFSAERIKTHIPDTSDAIVKYIHKNFNL